jgi:hypothetical protein
MNLFGKKQDQAPAEKPWHEQLQEMSNYPVWMQDSRHLQLSMRRMMFEIWKRLKLPDHLQCKDVHPTKPEWTCQREKDHIGKHQFRDHETDCEWPFLPMD